MAGYRAGTAYIQVSASLDGFQNEIRRKLREEMRGLDLDVPVEPVVDRPAQERVKRALSDLPSPKVKVTADTAALEARIAQVRNRLRQLEAEKANPKVDADIVTAEARLTQVRAQLDELSKKKSTPKVDADTAAARARIAALEQQLAALNARKANPRVDVDIAAAQAQLAALQAQLARLDNRRVDIRAVVDTGQSMSRIQALLTAGLALGPALIPVAASITAAFGAIGTGAILGVGSLGTLALGFGGVSDAVKALGEVHTKTGQSAQQSAAQQMASANAILSAQDSVRSSQLGLLNAEDQLRRAREQAGIAAETAARNVASALDRQRQSEQSLIDAQRQALRAQRDLTQARLDARRAAEDLAFSVEDNALALQRAELERQRAQFALNQIDPALGGGAQRKEAELALKEADLRLRELRSQGRRLAEDKAASDKAGIEGSRQVTAAQDAVAAANDRIRQAQDQVRESAATVTQAQVDGARQVRQANEAVTQAERGVEQAQMGIAAAARALTQAQAEQAEQATKTTAEQNKLAEAMAKLSPEGREFALFIDRDLRPKFQQLQATAQRGLLPGVQQGIRNALPQFHFLDETVGILARSLGDLATRAGTALNNPFWTGFFRFIRDEAGPSTQTFGTIIGNLAEGAAGLLQAFKPVWDDMGEGLKRLTERFANFGKEAAAGRSDSFNGFLRYVYDTWPTVKEFIKQLTGLVVTLAQAFGGQGASTLALINGLLRWINDLDPSTVRLLIDLFLAYKAFQIVGGVGRGIFDTYDTIRKIGDVLRDIRKGGGLAGALGKGGGVGGVGTGPGGIVARGTAAIVGGGLAAAGGSVAGGLNAQEQSKALQQQNAVNPPPAGVVVPTGYKAMGFGITADQIAKPFEDGRKRVNQALAGLNTDAARQFTQLRNTSGLLNQSAVAQMKQPWVDTPAYFARTWSGANMSTVRGFGDIKNTVGAGSRDTSNIVQGNLGDGGGLRGWLSRKWGDMWGDAKGAWGSIKGTVTGESAKTRDDTSGNINILGVNVTDSFRWATDTIGKIWSGLGGVVKPPVNFVIDPIYNKGIRGVWNWIAGTFGMPTLPPMALLASGGVVPAAPMVTNRPTAIVGEGGRHPEYVIPTDPKYRTRAQGLWAQAGTHLMASGGILGAVEAGWDWITGMLSDPAGTARRLFSGVTGLVNQIPGAGSLRDALARIPGKVVDAVAAAGKRLVATIGSAVAGGAGVERWRPIALQALQIAGQSASNVDRLLMQMRTESGGNPSAVNRSDINWQRGTPSVGLMQVIGPTYARYKHPAFDRAPYLYGVSTDGLSNILASIRYTTTRYGSLTRGWQGHGYDQGGLWLGGLGLNATGKPERVLDPRTTVAFEHLVDAITSNRSVAPIPLTAPRGGLAAGRVANAALMGAAVDQAVARVWDQLNGAELRIRDDGRGGIASITRRQGAQHTRRG